MMLKTLIRKSIFIAIISVVGFDANGQDSGGLQTSVAVDIAADTAFGGDTDTTDQLLVREAELMLYAPIDYIFDGVLSMAAHQESGQTIFELHEGYIGSSKLIPRSSFKVGQFFLGIGRLNRFHRHDWSFTSAPFIHTHIFNDEEGAIDSGVEYSFLFPLPFYLDLTIGVTNGFKYGHSHDTGKKPRKPTHYGHLKSFFVFGEVNVQPGLSYLHRTDNDRLSMTITGLDFTAKFSEGKILRYLLQSEFWHRNLQPKKGGRQDTFGFYIFPQWGINESLYLGFRYDYFTNLNLEDITGKSIQNKREAYVQNITYKPSEFSSFRISYNHENDVQEGQKTKISKFIEFQTTFILGAHPAHDF